MPNSSITPVEESSWVCIWKTTPKGVGHIGIQVGGVFPGDSTGTYRSFHPSLLPAFGPFVTYPIPSVTATSLIEDAMSETKVSENRGFGFDDEPRPKQPDAIFRSDRLNTSAMRASMDNEARVSRYQLFPGIHPWSFFEGAARDVAYDPGIERPTRPTIPKVHNCATYVAAVLKSGGALLSSSKTPWVMSPNSILEQLDQDEHFTRFER